MPVIKLRLVSIEYTFPTKTKYSPDEPSTDDAIVKGQTTRLMSN